MSEPEVTEYPDRTVTRYSSGLVRTVIEYKPQAPDPDPEMERYDGPRSCPARPESIGSLGMICQSCWRRTGTYDPREQYQRSRDIMRAVDCSSCGARRGLACSTRDGRRARVPHVPRWKAWRAWLSQQPVILPPAG